MSGPYFDTWKHQTLVRFAKEAYEKLQRQEEALTAICVKCRSNEWGPDTPRKEILNWMHDHASEVHTALRERLAQPQRTHWEGCEEVHPECKKTRRREWVGLTEADGVQIAIDCGCVDVAWLVFARAIEAKLKEKNA